MHFEQTIDIDAPAERVWRILTAIERWPEWTRSVRQVVRLTGADFRIGTRALLRQPGIQELEWMVTEIEPERYFAWETHNPGIKVLATHRITPLDSGGCRVRLTADQSGFVGLLLQPFIGGRTRRYMRMEAEGLKAEAEGDRAY